MNNFYRKSYRKQEKLRQYLLIAFGIILVGAVAAFLTKSFDSSSDITAINTDSAFTEAKTKPVRDPFAAADNSRTGARRDEPVDNEGNVTGDDATLEGGLPSRILDRLKDATVFIKVRHEYGQRGSGSGFLFLADGNDGYVVTNAHVVLSGGQEAEKVEVVFDCGHPAEKSYNADVIAHDSERDLALLKINSPNLPAPLDDVKTPAVRETMPVYIFGFPFGQQLSMDRDRSPEVTVSSGTVSSIRRDKRGNLSYVQVTGDINPGNSGGPIIDRRGNIIGVAVAKVRGTQIGLAIPTRSLRGFFEGRVDKSRVMEDTNAAGKAKITIKLHVIDPLKKMEKLGIVLIPEDEVKKPFPDNPDGSPAMVGDSLGDYKKCTWNRPDAQISFMLKGKPGTSQKYYFQVGYTDANNVVKFLEPTPFQLTFQAAGSVVAAKSARPGKSGRRSQGTPPPSSAPNLSMLKVVKTPAIITDCVPAGGGNYLVVFFKKLRKLGIFNFAQKKFTGYISVPSSEIVFTAGGSKIIAVDPGNGLIMRYDLFSGDRELTQRVPVTGVVRQIAMGSNTEGPLLVRWAAGTNSYDRASYDLVDIDTLQRIPLAKNIKAHYSRYGDNIHLRPSADGSVVGVWGSSSSDLGVFIFYEDSVEYKRDYQSVGAVVPGPNGRYLFTGRGGYYTTSLKSVSEDLKSARQVLIPALEGPYFLGLTSLGKGSRSYDREYDAVNVYITGSSTPLFTEQLDKSVIGKLSKGRGGYYNKTDFTLDRKVHFLPSSGTLAVIPDAADKIVLVPMNIMASLNKSGIDYLFVASQPRTTAFVDEEYSYQLKVISKHGKVKFSIESGPDGMFISDDGLVTWTPYSSDVATQVSVIILITDDSGQEIFHSFNINVR
jgi:S1-C subfamily serine protease